MTIGQKRRRRDARARRVVVAKKKPTPRRRILAFLLTVFFFASAARRARAVSSNASSADGHLKINNVGASKFVNDQTVSTYMGCFLILAVYELSRRGTGVGMNRRAHENGTRGARYAHLRRGHGHDVDELLNPRLLKSQLRTYSR